MTEPSDAQTFLFGGATPWTASDWTSSDDRVRGGKSESHLELLEGGASVQFHGVLDIRTLGLAGFASQRTTGDDRSWDLSTFDGIELALGEIDDNKYTLILKDSIAAGASRDGPDESTISYEYDFRLGSAQHKKLFVPWSSLKATYRGRDAKDAPKINLHNVKRIGLMMRSFFGEQEGPFSLAVESISARRAPLLPQKEEKSAEEVSKAKERKIAALTMSGLFCVVS